MSISANFPNVFPSLELNFAQSQQLDPRVTFSRSTTAPYYDGKTSVLAEQNLFLWSQQIGNSPWVKDNGFVATLNTTTAPDGTTTASSLIAPASTAFYNISQFSTVVIGLMYVVSFYVKANGYTKVFMGDHFGNKIAVTFDLTTATVISNIAGVGTITSVGSGWYRCSVTWTQTTYTTFALIIVGYPDTGATGFNSSGVSYTGDGTSGIYAWGAQLEQRTSVTAYNATTTSALTNYIPQLLTAAINQPRFDFNPTTGESLGLLIEQSSTNLLTYSQDFSNAVWTKTHATVTTTADIAPDGTQTFNLLQETTATGLHAISETYTKAASAITYTQSVYFKAKERTYSYIQVSDGSGNGAIVYFNLSTGVISTAVAGVGTAFTGLSATISLVGNNVYKCTLTSTSNTATSFVAQFGSSTDGSTNSYTGNGYSGIYIWGSQLEALAFPTSYIPTTTAQVTRASDNASMTGTNFSSWYNNAEGTVYTDAVVPTASYVSAISDGTANNYIVNRYNSSGTSAIVTTSGTIQANYGSPTLSGKNASTYKVNDFASSVNGASPATDTSGSIPTVNQLQIGSFLSANYANGTIKKIAYYPIRVTNTQLQALTGS